MCKLQNKLKELFGIKDILKNIKRQEYIIRRENFINHILNDCSIGITKERYTNHDIIVSLTTYGKRINDVAFTIESIMQQSIKPNRIILWLDNSFKEKKLPQSLLFQKKRGLEIAFCTDIRSYKKLVPALCTYPNDAIITIDDDCLYDYDILERLITAYLQDPQYIYCTRFHRMTFAGTNILPYNKWKWRSNIEEASHLNFATGVGGILYPPHSLDDEVTNETVFMDICKYADDVWFKAMAIKKGTLVKKVQTRSIESEDYLENGDVQDIGLRIINVKTDNLNDKQIKAVFEKYNLYSKLQ